jgi:recombination protein RecR
MAALERTRNYRGYYYVLMGCISPIDGVGPTELKLKQLLLQIDRQQPREVIIATNFTAEGDATAQVLMRMLESKSIKGSRLARGVPVGSELEYVDLSTIAHALAARM